MFTSFIVNTRERPASPAANLNWKTFTLSLRSKTYTMPVISLTLTVLHCCDIKMTGHNAITIKATRRDLLDNNQT